MKISILNLRKLIQEEIARNFHTQNNDPFSFENYEEVNIEIYPSQSGSAFHVKIESTDGSITLPVRSFANESEAKHYARNKTDEIRRILFSRNK